MVKTLVLELGADKEAATANGSRPLHKAAWQGHVTVVTTLVELGADKEAATADGSRPLQIAAYRGRVAVVKALVELGADKEASVRMDGHRCTLRRGRAMCQW